MTDAGFFRGTSAEQDNRFSDKEKKLLKQMKFGDNVLKKVDMSKVKLEVLRPWISKRVEEMLGMEDDVIEEFVVNQLEAKQFPDGRRIQINLTGFLNGKNARIFTAELWDMLLSAQEQSTGIPVAILESKQDEIKKRNEEQERITETLKKTVSRFADQLKVERSSPPPSSSRSSQKPSPLTADNSKKETSSNHESRRDQDFNKRKDDGGKRQYRSRRSPSNSPPRRSRSRSNDRKERRGGFETRRDYERGRDRNWSNRGRDNGDRFRERTLEQRRSRSRSRSPVKMRRSPPRHSYQGRSRELERPQGSTFRSQRRKSPDYNADGGKRAFEDLRSRNKRRRDRSGSIDDVRGRNTQNGSSRQTSPIVERDREKGRDAYRSEKFCPVLATSSPTHNSEIAKKPINLRHGENENEKSDRSIDSDGADSSPSRKSKKDKKNKKEKKKHKKHKKTRKSKKSTKNGSGPEMSNSEGDGEDENDAQDEEDGRSASEGSADDRDRNRKSITSSSFLKYIDTAGGEALEKKLRAKALESLKKRIPLNE